VEKIRSRITAQGQISIPAQIRRKLGIGPGSVIEWEQSSREDVVMVKKAAEYTLEDLHNNVFPDGAPEAISVHEMDEAIKNYIRKKHARR
jgi:AbrB family looped-hinge helix DNA binding protein